MKQKIARLPEKKREYVAPASVAKKIVVNSVMLTAETL